MIDYRSLVEQPFYAIENKNLLLQAYQEVFNLELCSTCSSSYFQAYNQLKQFVRNQKINIEPMAKTKCKYQFKPEHEGSEIHIKGIGKVTKDSLTDEVAEELLKHPAYESILELIPAKVEKK
jgi:hypothetical protein